MKADELEALGRRAVACKRWRWMPGMLLLWKLHERGGTYRGRVCHLGSSDSGTEKDVYCEGRGDRFDGILEVPNCYPDFSDPATLGCLLAIVREAWRAPHAAPQWDQRWQHWAVLTPNYDQECESWKNLGADDTEAEALVVALETAP